LTRTRRAVSSGTLRVAVAAVASSVLLVSCGRAPEKSTAEAPRAAAPPKGDAVWFLDSAGAAEAGTDERLTRLSAAALFLPAGTLGLAGGSPTFEPAPSPSRATGAPPVVLVVRADASIAPALGIEGGFDPASTADLLAQKLQPLLALGGGFGRVIGVHLDFPFSATSAKHSGELVTALKSRLSAVFVSIAAPFSPSTEEARKALQPLTSVADALVAPIFGFDERADPGAIDSLGRPWWAAFGASAHGTIVSASSGRTSAASEAWLDRLIGNPNVDFENDLSVPDASFTAFQLVVRGPVKIDDVYLEPGDRVSYRVPALAEMLFQLGSMMAGKRHSLGRLLVFDGKVEAERVFPVAAFEDVLLGRSLVPVLQVTVSPAGRNAIAVEAVNRTTHASIPSRSSNWVEVDVAPARAGDVALGGFDRYATFDGNEQPVTPGRASRVRLFETLIVPNEVISAARIPLRGRMPERCCRYRTHLIAASGSEETSGWIEPPVPPTPTPSPKKAARSAKAKPTTPKKK
jgi:hypothetical protein